MSLVNLVTSTASDITTVSQQRHLHSVAALQALMEINIRKFIKLGYESWSYGVWTGIKSLSQSQLMNNSSSWHVEVQ